PGRARRVHRLGVRAASVPRVTVGVPRVAVGLPRVAVDVPRVAVVLPRVTVGARGPVALPAGFPAAASHRASPPRLLALRRSRVIVEAPGTGRGRTAGPPATAPRPARRVRSSDACGGVG